MGEENGSLYFDGVTYDPTEDKSRISTQLYRVLALMRDGEWRILSEIARFAGGSEAGVSARLRDLRKRRFGSYQVNRRRVENASGLWEYRIYIQKENEEEETELEMPKPNFDTSQAKYESFPLISSFPRADMDRARELMEEERLYAEQEDALKATRDSIRKELAEIAERNGVEVGSGFRWGQFAAYYSRSSGRRTLKKDLLIERCYCTAEQVEECTTKGKDGEPTVKVVDLSKPKAAREDQE